MDELCADAGLALNCPPDEVPSVASLVDRGRVGTRNAATIVEIEDTTRATAEENERGKLACYTGLTGDKGGAAAAA